MGRGPLNKENRGSGRGIGDDDLEGHRLAGLDDAVAEPQVVEWLHDGTYVSEQVRGDGMFHGLHLIKG